MTFQLARDSSPNQVPVVGRNSLDVQDAILYGTRQITETLASDANGFVTTSSPILDLTHDFNVDSGGILRDRRVDGSDLTALTSTGTQLFPGVASPQSLGGPANRVQVFRDQANTVAASSTQVTVTYRTLVPLSLDVNGNLISGTGAVSGTVDVSDRPARDLGRTRPKATDWAVYADPPAGSVASASQGAAGGVVHVCHGFSATLAVGAAAPIAGVYDVFVRDGAPGVGSILWAEGIAISASPGDRARVGMSGLDIPGTAGAAMTVEFNGAPQANVYQRVSMSGYSQ